MLFNSKTALLVLLIIALCFNYVNAAKKVKLTKEQLALKEKMRAERRKKSEAADAKIQHTSAENFKDVVLNDEENLWVVFYGSKKCPHTQKFNPKWLQFQENMKSGVYGFENVKFTKVECYGKQFDFCVSQDNQYWPELMFYYNGVKKGAYDGEDEIEDIVKYIKEKKDIFMKNTKSKTTKTVKENDDESPVTRPPKNPSKRPPPPKKPSTKTIPPTYQKEDESKEVNNAINDEYENNYGDEPVEIKHNNINTNVENANDQAIEEIEEKGKSSHTGLYTVGGCVACVACLFFIKNKFRSRGYMKVGTGERSAQMRYKYDKHIV